jgi:acyl-CoA synthetase (AMP-forming)/AMP-acid ligase II
VHHLEFAPRISDAFERAGVVRRVWTVDDDSPTQAITGAISYEAALTGAAPGRNFPGRSGEDIYIAYTGGTTGAPKGVVWRHEDIFFAAMGGGDATSMIGPIGDPDDIVDRILDVGIVMLSTPPLMHVSAQWGAFSTLFGGGTLVLPSPGRLDPEEIWNTVAKEQVNVLTMVGDAMARPLLDHLAVDPGRHDTSSMLVFASGGAVLSPSTKSQIAALLPRVITIDGLGSTETGVTGSRARMPGTPIDDGSRFALGSNSAVLDEDLQPVEPGSGVVGRLARRGRVPIAYYRDAQKSADTFVEINGERWAITGDAATVEPDGTISLLGRGSVSINTGGEKVYPDEVETVLKDHRAVYDAIVVGVPHERWGEEVVAVVSFRPGVRPPGLESLQRHARASLAGYKVPRRLCVVDVVARGPNGKADYAWARAVAAAE